MTRPLLATLAACFLAVTATAGAAWAATPAPAEPSAATSPLFLLVGAAPDLSQVGYVDSTNMSRSGKQVTVWTVWVWPALPAMGEKRVSYVTRRNTYDCTARTNRQELVKIYAESGEVLFDGPPSATPVFEAITPGTIGEATLGYVCDGVIAFPDQASQTSIPDTVKAARALAAKLKAEKAH